MQARDLAALLDKVSAACPAGTLVSLAWDRTFLVVQAINPATKYRHAATLEEGDMSRTLEDIVAEVAQKVKEERCEQ